MTDLIRAVDARIIVRFQSLEPIGEVRCVLHVDGKVVGLDVANSADIAYLGVTRFDDFSIVFEKGFCLFKKRIEAADEVIASAVATIELKIAFRAWKDKFQTLRFLIAARKRHP